MYRFLLLLATGLALSVGLHAQEAKPQASPTTLESKPETFNTKATSGQQRVVTEFELTNAFSTEARIVDVMASCECLDVYMPTHKIPPGGKLFIRVELDLTNRSLPQARSVYLTLEGVPQEEVVLKLLVEPTDS